LAIVIEPMPKRSGLPAELRKLGQWLFAARMRQGFTQKELADRSGIAQPRVSGIEQGLVLPTLPQVIQLARALSVPLQWFLNGATEPGSDVPELALELHNLGIVDLLIPDAVVPGAFRPVEQVVVLAVSGNQPDPRIIEAIPAVLAWNRFSAVVLRAYCRRIDRRAGLRLAWLADMVLTVHRVGGFPGGCRQRRALEAMVRWWVQNKPPAGDDDLGRPAKAATVLPPLWRRWKIRYDAPLSAFVERARHLHALRDQRRSHSAVSARPTDD
jgi:transcriptional regulator with XRE-family HTH domain